MARVESECDGDKIFSVRRMKQPPDLDIDPIHSILHPILHHQKLEMEWSICYDEYTQEQMMVVVATLTLCVVTCVTTVSNTLGCT